MTPEDFEALLRFLHPDRDKAGEMYEDVYKRLVRLFEWRGCPCPEELADETMDRVARRIRGGTEIQTADPFRYFVGVAHLVYKEVWRREERQRNALNTYSREPPWPLDPEADGRLDCLRRCLQFLPGEQRRLILHYHGDDDRIASRQKLATELDIEINALRIRAHRIRRDLEHCVRRCLVER